MATFTITGSITIEDHEITFAMPTQTHDAPAPVAHVVVTDRCTGDEERYSVDSRLFFADLALALSHDGDGLPPVGYVPGAGQPKMTALRFIP